MSRRKGTPCACESDPCGCGSSKGKCIRAINNVPPDPNGDFTVEAGAGILISEGENKIVITNINDPVIFTEGQNIEISISGDNVEIGTTDNISVNNINVSEDADITGDVNIGGDLNIAGDIIQQGSSYETHAEQVYTTKDYIYMRDGALAGLSAGDFSGFQVKKYDGTNDGRLVIDNSGTARVGDVGDEQPLLTRDESADLTDGECLVWDSVNSKAVTQSIPSDIATALAGKQPLFTQSKESIGLGSFGFQYGNVIKYSIAPNTYLYRVYGGLHTAGGTFLIDNTVTTSDNISTPLYDPGSYLLTGHIKAGSTGISIIAQAGKWLYGELVVVIL